MTAPAATRRTYLHVGVPKSGTTFLQAALRQHHDALREVGVLFPGGFPEPMFRAALDVRGDHEAWGRTAADVEGSWARLCAQAREFDGTTVISHELLGGVSTETATRARAELSGLDVHVVVTARDLARQLTAEWQEGIKHGRAVTFQEFCERVLGDSRAHEHAASFWAAQGLAGVLSRWTAGLPAGNVHVVCCPPPSADPLLLWQRFAEVVGFDAAAFPPSAGGSSNTSLGVVQIDLLRRVNAALDGRIVQPAYGKVVKQYFAKQLLVPHRSPRPQLPLSLYDELSAVGKEWVEEITRAGYCVHGDLASLVPVPPEEPAGPPHPDEVDPVAEVETASAVIADLLVEVDRLRGRTRRLESRQPAVGTTPARLGRALARRLRR